MRQRKQVHGHDLAVKLQSKEPVTAGLWGADGDAWMQPKDQGAQS